MKLPNGITGFFHVEEEKPPTVDGKQFKKYCFEIIYRIGGIIKVFKEPEYPMNFYHVVVSFNNKDIHLLLNEHYPYLAFASKVECDNIDFIDVAILKKHFNPYYSVLNANELNAPVVNNNGAKKGVLDNDYTLSSTELEKIKYWSPERVGEIIFNYWD